MENNKISLGPDIAAEKRRFRERSTNGTTEKKKQKQKKNKYHTGSDKKPQII